MKPLLIGIAGGKGEGKDTVAQMIIDRFPLESVRIAFADSLKMEVAQSFKNPNHQYWDFRGKPFTSFMRRAGVSYFGCWEWQGKKSEKGYGVVYTSKVENYKAHRFMMIELLKNQSSELVKHSCDNPCCVNPIHLSYGTSSENSAEMVSKNRSSRGEAHSQATITDDLVESIRTQYRSGKRQAVIARKTGLPSGTISRIVNNLTRQLPPQSRDTFLETAFFSEWLNKENKHKFRYLLQNYGTEFRRSQDENYWIAQLNDKILRYDGSVVVIPDVRFPNEFDYIKEQGGVVWNVTRDIFMDHLSKHASETSIIHFAFDFTFANNGTLDQLRANVDMMVNGLKV